MENTRNVPAVRLYNATQSKSQYFREMLMVLVTSLFGSIMMKLVISRQNQDDHTVYGFNSGTENSLNPSPYSLRHKDVDFTF